MAGAVTAYTLIVLAGGRGRRLGGRDKGLLTLGQQGFVEALTGRLRCMETGIDDILISANRHHDEYGRIGAQVCADLRPGFQGPLAGLEATLARAPACQPAVIVPCDMPLLPQSLPRRLLAPVVADAAKISVLHDGQRRQHLCLALWPGTALPSLREHLDRGQRSVAGWLSGQRIEEVSGGNAGPGSHALCWRNVNDPVDFRLLAASVPGDGAADTVLSLP